MGCTQATTRRLSFFPGKARAVHTFAALSLMGGNCPGRDSSAGKGLSYCCKKRAGRHRVPLTPSVGDHLHAYEHILVRLCRPSWGHHLPVRHRER